MFTRTSNLAVALSLLFSLELAAAADTPFVAGVAKLDITPDYPIRLTGYAVRKTESEGTEQRLWAKALALGSDPDGPAILMTVDNCGVGANVIDNVADRLKAKAGVARERLAVCSSHTHSGPCTVGFAPNIFAMPIPADQQATIERYTRELTDKLEQVALAALADRKPARLAWNQGKVTFARNRRTAGGPVDHALPTLAVTDLDGKWRAVVANYACHCTTLGGEFNKLCGDWAGYAQEAIERDHPGGVALITIGCGADANPHPRGGQDGGLALAKQHGQELGIEVKRMLDGALIPLRQKLSCNARRIELPFDKPNTREQWEERAKQEGIVGYHARRNLERLDRGEKLPATLPYFVQVWNFGDQLALVFLGGEVVVDYALRLKREFESDRLWVTAYANDVPCYIPSRRILQEGGYEAETSLWYYDRPTRLAPAVEDLIDATVFELMPAQFRRDPKKAEFPAPKSADEALAAFRTRPGLKVELVAAEPLIFDPVAIDWGADGKLWVCEMRDYPSGMDGNWKPGGRVKLLEDVDGDGRYDKATLFLDNLPFPTGVMAWNGGVLVCAAPDIIYAKDTDADGRADTVEKLFTGFATENYQARVNSLSLGLDNWIYGANGLIGGKIRAVGAADRGASAALELASAATQRSAVNISGRDFRLHPDTGEFEPASGLTQQGRVRDDWGNWFGCDNSTLLWHYPLPEHYVRRNPHVAAPEPRVFVPANGDPNQLFPTSHTLTRFNDPSHVNRTTSACGLGLYRDDRLGAAFYGNAFVCEPVHNLVHRLVLEPRGGSFTADRAVDEQQSEFLASQDNWFRPVQARTGPDGALYIVDMYRFVIEHPRWIPPERLAKLDVRAGADKGRIYRVAPARLELRPVRDLTKLSAAELVARLDTPNGTERDRVHLELLRRKDRAAVGPLLNLFERNEQPAVRVQALCVLDGLKALSPELLEAALTDAHPAVRRQAVRLSEPLLGDQASRNHASSPSHLSAALLQLVKDPDLALRYQLALSLGEWNDPRAGEALGQLAQSGLEDQWLRAAVLSSATRFAAEILTSILAAKPDAPHRTEMVEQLIVTAVSTENKAALERVLTLIAPPDPEVLEPWRLSALTSLVDALNRRGASMRSLASSTSASVRSAVERIEKSFDTAFSVVKSASADDATREAAIRLVGRSTQEDTVPWLGSWLSPKTSLRLQTAAVEALAGTASPKVPELLLKNWHQHSPALRGVIIPTLLARDDWVNALLDAIQKGTATASEVSPADRQRLRQHKNGEIQRRAAALFSAGHATRAEVIERYKVVANLSGDAARGAMIFEKNCSQCHALGGQGHAVGPDLKGFRDKSVEDFLVAMLDPSAAIEPRFINYQVETGDGRSLSGVINAESATALTLVQGGGIEERILRSDIVEIRASALSLMPDGLEQSVSPQEMADLIAYLTKAGL